MDTREEEALAAQQAACKAARGSGPGWQPWRSWSRRHEEVANAEVQDATCSDTQVAPPSQGSSQRSSCSSAGTEEGGGTTGRLTACAQQGEAGGAAGRWKWLRDLTVCFPRKRCTRIISSCSLRTKSSLACCVLPTVQSKKRGPNLTTNLSPRRDPRLLTRLTTPACMYTALPASQTSGRRTICDAPATDMCVMLLLLIRDAPAADMRCSCTALPARPTSQARQRRQLIRDAPAVHT